ncbi:MAG TPA: hypothetical protein VFP84_24020, partial [Kofleriaceae bacterium]|nr:hypothetical protein [Kofleriaceae bacterium]
LVARAALADVPAHNRDRLAAADPRELAARVAQLHADNAAELAHHPAGPALAQITARIGRARRARRRRWLAWLGTATSVAAVAVVAVQLGASHPSTGDPVAVSDDGVRVKGSPRLLAFRQTGASVERLGEDAICHAGDVIQLKLNPGGARFGLIASADGSGVVTLHFPLDEHAAPAATALPPDTTTLPQAYALDDAPRFERFFFFTADAPIDVQATLASVRAFARRDDSATTWPQLPAELHQWSLRLRKPDRSSTSHESP